MTPPAIATACGACGWHGRPSDLVAHDARPVSRGCPRCYRAGMLRHTYQPTPAPKDDRR